MQKQMKLPYVVTSTLIVGSNDLDVRSALNMCRMLSVANQHNDDTLCTMTGNLDYNQISVQHYALNVVGMARLNDQIVFRSHAWYSGDNSIEIILEAYKRKDGGEQIIMNGSFVFTVKAGIPVCLALS